MGPSSARTQSGVSLIQIIFHQKMHYYSSMPSNNFNLVIWQDLLNAGAAVQAPTSEQDPPTQVPLKKSSILKIMA
jgi:hypothetical protein